MIKNYNDCYLFKKFPQYGESMKRAITKEERVDKKEERFKSVIYEINRTRISPYISKFVMEDNVVLLNCQTPMPKPLKVFYAKDIKIKDDKKKIFIDVGGVIKQKETMYSVDETRLISYLINALNVYKYSVKNSFSNIQTTASCFAMLFTHIIDYLEKISTMDSSRTKCLYLSSYYFCNIMGINQNTMSSISRSIAGISTIKEISYGLGKLDEDAFDNINNFINKVIRPQLRLKEATLSLVTEKWMQFYGTSTVFGLEYPPAFFALLTDAYCGSYINNQNTIEKICGRELVTAAKGLIE